MLDFEFILNNGLKGYIDLIDKQTQKNELLEAMKIVLNLLGELSLRYSGICKDEKLSKNLKKVPMYPCETFYEAVSAERGEN